MKLSVIIITKNEAANIAACLKSVAFADEFIVVDSGSTDGTGELAQALGARVEITSDWPGFGPQKNRALDLATGKTTSVGKISGLPKNVIDLAAPAAPAAM